MLGLLILFMNGLLTAAFAHGVAEGDKRVLSSELLA